MQKTGVRSLGRNDPLKKGMATHSSILAWSLAGYSPWGCIELDTTERPSTVCVYIYIYMCVCVCVYISWITYFNFTS